MVVDARLRESLARNRFFAELEASSLDTLDDALFTVRALPAGHVLVRQGEPADAMYLIFRGRVTVSSSLSDGSPTFLVERTDDDFVGEMGLIEDARRSASLACATDCEVAIVARDGFLRMLSLLPGLGTNLARAISQRLREATHQRAIQVDVHAKLLELNRTIAEQRSDLLEKNAALERLNEELLRKNEELYRSATVDALTQALNRSTILDALGRELRRSARYRNDVACIILDVDHFKALNDRHGHLAGDHVLRETARVITREIRELDSLGRYGGEEFLVVLPQTDAEKGFHVSERIRTAVEGATQLWDGKPLRVTISLGVAASKREGSSGLEDLLRQADAALYEAKQLGRNRSRKHPG